MNRRIYWKLFLAFVPVLLVEAAFLTAIHVAFHWILFALLASLAMAAIMAALLGRGIASHLSRLEEFASNIASGNFAVRLDGMDSEEATGLTHTLDETAIRLEERFRTLEEERRQFTALLDSMQDAVIAINPQGQVSWCNAMMNRLTATPVQCGRALAHSVRDPEILSAVDNALNHREVSHARAISLVPGKVLEVNAAPTPDGGAVAVLHDVSEVERAHATRRDFVANVSHELRTPLTCINGYVETLLDDPGLSGQTREFLQIILKNGMRMNRLTEDLLALASVESRDYKLQSQPKPAGELVQDALNSLAGLARDSGQVLEIAETTAEPVLADPDALNQVFANLVENAIKYGRTGGRILLGARREDAFVEFYVRDFGPGIASEHASRIFERFYRVDKARSRESGGTGLGLAIAKHIVQAHDGDIRCESELGFGATFLFRLPVLAQPLVRPPSAASGMPRDLPPETDPGTVPEPQVQAVPETDSNNCKQTLSRNFEVEI